MQQYMVIERFKEGCWAAAYERFGQNGRMLPEGLYYLNSWANQQRSVCYQLMETDSPALFDLWFAKWADIITFELIPIDDI